jgi:hypothetical protein
MFLFHHRRRHQQRQRGGFFFLFSYTRNSTNHCLQQAHYGSPKHPTPTTWGIYLFIFLQFLFTNNIYYYNSNDGQPNWHGHRCHVTMLPRHHVTHHTAQDRRLPPPPSLYHHHTLANNGPKESKRQFTVVWTLGNGNGGSRHDMSQALVCFFPFSFFSTLTTVYK